MDCPETNNPADKSAETVVMLIRKGLIQGAGTFPH